MNKTEKSVEILVGQIERGELRLPEMQRGYVWKSSQVRDLLDSLYRGYPSGTILVWDTDDNVPQREFAIEQQANPYRAQLLLDGQQRLTSLSAVIRGKPVAVRDRKKPIEILFNLEHPDDLTVVTEVDEDQEESGYRTDDEAEDRTEDEVDSTEDEILARSNQMTFVVATKKLEQLPCWVKVSDVLKNEDITGILKDAGITDLEDPRYGKYSKRLGRLRDIRKYQYRMDVLERTLPYKEVTEIFVRVNSRGTKLRGSDLALAQITAKWRGSLAIFQDFQKKCKASDFGLELGIHLRNLVAFATGQSGFHTVGALPVDQLQSGWKECVAGMEFALNFLKSNATIVSPALLSSPFLIVALSYYAHKRNYHLSQEEADLLRHWVLLTNAKGRYSRGSSETLLDQDLGILKQAGKGAEEMLSRLRQQVGRLDISPGELEGRNQGSALFKTMFLAFRAAGAKDWRSNLALDLDHSGESHKIQFHHIFPRAVLKKDGYTPQEINDIANLAFISGKTNRRISNKQPDEYFPQLIQDAGPAPFEAQCIPTDSRLLTTSAYKEFLQERRKMISRRLNEFLDVEPDA